MRKIPKRIFAVYLELSGSSEVLILNVMFLLSFMGKDFKLE